MSNVNWNDYTPIDDKPDGAAAGGAVDWSQFEPVEETKPGFIPTVKRTAGQMLTTAATTAEDVTGPNAVTRAVQETGQGIIDRNPAGIRSLRDLVNSPWLAVKESVGQFAPQIAAAGAGGIAGAKAGSAMGRLLGPAGAAVGGTVGGVVGGLAPIFTQEYGGIRQEQKEAGQEDKARALAAAIPATALERVGMGKALSVLKGVPGGAAGTVLKEVGKGVLKEGATEGAQNVIEQWGAFKDPTKAENIEDTALAAAMGGIGGGVMGGASGVADRVRGRGQQSAEQLPANAVPADTAPVAGDGVSVVAEGGVDASVAPDDSTPATLFADQAGNVGPTPEATSSAAATPAINPNDGPISKVASQAAELSLVPETPAPVVPDARNVLGDAIDRLTPEQQREAQMLQADLGNEDLPAGVRAFREGEARTLASAAAPVEPGIQDMDSGRVMRGFDARRPDLQGFDAHKPDLPDVNTYADLIDSAVAPKYREQVRQRLNDAQNPALPPQQRAAAAEFLHGMFSPEALWNARNATSTPEAPLSLQPSEQQRFGNEIDFAPDVQAPAPAPFAEQIAALAIADGKEPGQALRLNEAHALRNRAIDAGIPATVVFHPSGRGYDVQPSVRLTAEHGAPVPSAGPAMLSHDSSSTGRMLAGADGVRAESRAEVMQRVNEGRDQRIALEQQRAQREALGMDNHTRISPVREAQPAQVPATVPQADGRVIDVTAREVKPAQMGHARGAQPMPEVYSPRHPTWRTNAIQAGMVARDLGLNPRGKRVSQIVAEIDAADAAQAEAERGQPNDVTPRNLRLRDERSQGAGSAAQDGAGRPDASPAPAVGTRQRVDSAEPRAAVRQGVPDAIGSGERASAVAPAAPAKVQPVAQGSDLKSNPSSGNTAGTKADDFFEDIPFRRTGSSTSTFSPEARMQAIRSVEQTVNAIRAAWGGNADVVVAFDMQDPVVPESARRADLKQRSGGARGAPEGFYYRGKTYLMASRLNSPQDAARVLFHEVLGHHGLRGRFGKELDTILNQVANMRKPEVDAKIKEYGLRGVNRLDRRAAAEEVLANLAETHPEMGFVRRAVAAIRTWLRENVPGFKNLELTDGEIIRSYILPAREWVIRGGAGANGSLETSFSRSDSMPTELPDAIIGDALGAASKHPDYAAAKAGDVEAAVRLAQDLVTPDVVAKVRAAIGDARPLVVPVAAEESAGRNKIPRAAAEVLAQRLGLETASGIVQANRAHRTGLDGLDRIFAPVDFAGTVAPGDYLLVDDTLTQGGTFAALASHIREGGGTVTGVVALTGKQYSAKIQPSSEILSSLRQKHGDLEHEFRAATGYGFDALTESEARYLARYEPSQRLRDRIAEEGRRGRERQDQSHSGQEQTGDDDVRFSRSADDTPAAQRVGDMLKSVTVTNIKKQAGFKAADLRHLGLQMLGRRQLVDVYGDMLPELRTYSDLMARMDADKNEAGAGADQLATEWGKLKDERALAELMHDSTLAQMDPTREYQQGDNAVRYGDLHRRFNSLSPEAKDIYTRARDTYRKHMRDMRNAIKERIERAEMSSERRAEMLKRMDNEFFGHIKGVYFPLARFGQYLVVVKDAEGKVSNVSRAESMSEADEMRRQMLVNFPAAQGFNVGKVLKSKDFVADRDTVGRGFMEQLYGVLDKQGMDGKQRAELEDALGQLYLSSLPDLSWAKHGMHRKGTAGFSQDARRAFAQNVFHGASYLAKLRYGDQLQEQLGDMQERVDGSAHDTSFDSVKGQHVVDEIVKRHDAAMNPKSSAVSTFLTSLGFIFHLGLSPASAMVNLTQTALVAYPVMGARWGFGKSSAALLKASQETARGKNDITGALNPDERAAFDEAVRSGVVDVTMAHDLAGIAQGEDRNVSHKLAPVMRVASAMFHHAEKFNRQVTFIAAYRLAREAGADQKQAYADAVQATYDGHFDYSANNRPRFMQGNWQKVLLLFKQYSQNMVYTFARSAHQALKGASPEDRAVARKTLAGLLTTHAMAAGVLGLPMVTTLLAAASMLGGDDDEPWDAQVALQNLLADTFGQKPAEVLAHGLSRLTPWDISGRVGLDKLIFPDVQEGLEGQRLGEAAMTAALGPVAAIGVNALKGLQEMGEGRYARGLETMAPTVLRGPLKAFRYGTEGVKDKSGIVIQDEVDAASLLGQAAGFSPSDVRNAYEGKSAIVGHDKALQARRSALVEQFAMAVMSKDDEGKADARAAIAKFNEKNPNRRILPMQLAQSVHARQKRIREAEDGVYLPKKRRDVLEQGRFATGD
ncbi:phosphoribosyltransferase [Diaphorobacter sp. HDW4A]|uniref:PLxRFG domain-containing protein n=1 Tax=Diaphorobacter sp. HDW4A TaxID=2714924 RepID=UPI001407357A|nr:PLxRFG domain-containing protein [Diaphorobacter sp. HDW4A]QIL80984.1 phosphoribosyltransferase [Diaphorobacter sp. HDW4A]